MVQGKSIWAGGGCKGPGEQCGPGASGDCRDTGEPQRLWGPSRDLGGPGAFGRRGGSCGAHARRIPPAVGLRPAEGQGQKQGDQAGSSTVARGL